MHKRRDFALQYRSSRALLEFSPFRWLFVGHAVTAPATATEERLNWASDAPMTIKRAAQSTFVLNDALKKGAEGQLLYLVMVRHPLQWLLSMLKEPYGLKCQWQLAKRHDVKWLKMPCRIRFHITAQWTFANPLDVWNTYHRGYLNATYLPQGRTKIVRYEDLVAKTEATLNSILDAAGRPALGHASFRQATAAAKDHGKSGANYLLYAVSSVSRIECPVFIVSNRVSSVHCIE
jgi:hypothetical protein